MSANKKQAGGSHYMNKPIQPWDYIEANGIPFLEGCAIKYLTRWRDKGGVLDLKKAIHFIEKRIELEEAKGVKRGPARVSSNRGVREKVGRVGGVSKKATPRKVRN